MKIEVKDTGGLSDDTTQVVTVSVANTAPTASFTVTPSSGTTLTEFQFDASGSSDAEDEASLLEVRWDWENDEVWDTGWSTTKTWNHQYGTAGAKTIMLEVKDTGGLSDSTTRTVDVAIQPSVTVTVPKGGENWREGDADTIRWTSTGLVVDVKIEYSIDGGSGWSPVVESTTNSGSYIWVMPDDPSSMCRVRVSSVSEPTVYDISDADFTIWSQGPTPGETVVPWGMFKMGDGVAVCGTQEHDVALTHTFYLGKYEVTNQQYRDALQWAYDQNPPLVMVSGEEVIDQLDGSWYPLLSLGPSYSKISFSGGEFTVAPGWENHPVVYVNWFGAASYCDWLSMQQGLDRAYSHTGWWLCNGGNPYTARGYRLPTDAEWEHAAQYDDERIYPWGNEPADCSRANFYYVSDCVGGTSPVGSYPAAPASLELYDMAGNVMEWCNDRFTCDLGTESAIDPTGPPPPGSPVQHGGAWGYYKGYEGLRCAYRTSTSAAGTKDAKYGFRCARSQ